MRFSWLSFLFVPIMLLGVLPACVSLSERQNTNLSDQERLEREVRENQRLKLALQAQKSSSTVVASPYRPAPYDPDEWSRVVRAAGPRRALTDTRNSYRFHSSGSEAGWVGGSPMRLYRNAAEASAATGVPRERGFGGAK